MTMHLDIPFPHPGACPGCRNLRRCNFCGVSIITDGGRCTNGRCSKCHRTECTSGGATEPGHGFGPNTPLTLTTKES